MGKSIKIKQHSVEDCGAACLASIASFYGLEISITTLRAACGTDTGGSSIKGLLDGANSIGMKATALKAVEKYPSQLTHCEAPVILHLKKQSGWLHFIVLYKCNSKTATIMDPDDGYFRKVSLTELMEEWSGYLVKLEPTLQFEKGNKKENLRNIYLKLVNANKRELIPSIIGAFAYIIAGISTSLFLKLIIDTALPNKDINQITLYSILMIIIAILAIVTNYLRTLFTLQSSLKIDSTLTSSFIRKLLNLSPSFLKTRSSGELNSRINDINIVRNFISAELLIIILSISSLIVAIFILFTFYWKLALIAIAALPFYILLYWISHKVNRESNRKMIMASARWEEFNIETLSYVESIRYMNAENTFYKKAQDEYSKLLTNIYSNSKLFAIFNSLSETISKGLTITALIAGSMFVIGGELSLGEFVSFFTIISIFMSPITALIDSNDKISEAGIASERLFEILGVDSEEKSDSLDLDLTTFNKIEVKDLTLTYPGKLSILKNLSFDIVKGENLLIEGLSGSGKSSIASLLMKGTLPSSGSILIDGININSLSTYSWRQLISIVPQKVEIFNGTLLDNIAPNSSSPDLKYILELCKEIGLMNLINKTPEGLLGLTGERGCKLSGGEKQKIAIIRALYRKPQILILDEGASFLDKESVEKISKYLKYISTEKKITLVIISHGDKFTQLANKTLKITKCA